MPRRLRLTRAAAERVDELSEHPWLQQEMEVCATLVRLAFQCAGRYIWAHLPFYFSLPSYSAVLLLEDPQDRAEAADHLENMVVSLMNAEDRFQASKNPTFCSHMKTLLDHMGWPNFQLPRRLMALLMQRHFNLDDLTCRRMAARMFRGPAETKSLLEDTFAHLHRATPVNKKMANWTKYLYMTTARSPGRVMKHVLPDDQTWAACSQGKAGVSLQDDVFDFHSTVLPEPESEESVLASFVRS